MDAVRVVHAAEKTKGMNSKISGKIALLVAACPDIEQHICVTVSITVKLG